MSRTTSAAAPSHATKSAPAMSSSTTQACLPHDKVAKRAYEKWVKAGCKHGCDQQHWYEAEAEIRAEMTKPGKK